MSAPPHLLCVSLSNAVDPCSAALRARAVAQPDSQTDRDYHRFDSKLNLEWSKGRGRGCRGSLFLTAVYRRRAPRPCLSPARPYVVPPAWGDGREVPLRCSRGVCDQNQSRGSRNHQRISYWAKIRLPYVLRPSGCYLTFFRRALFEIGP